MARPSSSSHSGFHSLSRNQRVLRSPGNEWLFASQKVRFGKEAEAKKRMFNLPNRNLIENKGTLEEQS